MTRDEIIRMAREAGLGGFLEPHWGLREELERFADLVAAHTLSNIDPSSFMSYQEGFAAGAAAEREAIAQMIEDAPELVPGGRNDQGGCVFCGFDPKFAASYIRARGETK